MRRQWPPAGPACSADVTPSILPNVDSSVHLGGTEQSSRAHRRADRRSHTGRAGCGGRRAGSARSIHCLDVATLRSDARRRCSDNVRACRSGARPTNTLMDTGPRAGPRPSIRTVGASLHPCVLARRSVGSHNRVGCVSRKCVRTCGHANRPARRVMTRRHAPGGGGRRCGSLRGDPTRLLAVDRSPPRS